MPPSITKDGLELDSFDRGVEAPTRSIDPATVTKPLLPRSKAPKQRQPLKSYTTAQVASHNTKGDAWIIYKGQILDITNWISSHPGGEQTISRFAGMDATDELRSFHDDWVLETKLPHFVIGTVSDAPETTELVEDFRQLGEEFEKLGYFHVTPWFYVRKVVTVFCILAIEFIVD